MKKSRNTVRSSTLLPADKRGRKKAERSCAARRCLPALADLSYRIYEMTIQARERLRYAEVKDRRKAKWWAKGEIDALVELSNTIDRMRSEAPAGNAEVADPKDSAH